MKQSGIVPYLQDGASLRRRHAPIQGVEEGRHRDRIDAGAAPHVPQHAQLLLFDVALQLGLAPRLPRFRHRPSAERPAIRLVRLLKRLFFYRQSLINRHLQVPGRVHARFRLRESDHRPRVLRLDVPRGIARRSTAAQQRALLDAPLVRSIIP